MKWMIHDHSTHDGVPPTKQSKQQTNMATYREETGFQVELFYSRKVSSPRKAYLYRFRTDHGWRNHTHAIQDAISPTIWICFFHQGQETHGKTHMMEESSELFAVGSRRGDSGFRGEGPQLQWKTCVIQTRRKPFVQLQFTSTFVKDTFVQNDNKTKYRKDSTNIPPQGNTRHFRRMPLRFAV